MNDTVEMFIEKIKFVDVEGREGLWIEHSPGMSIYIRVQNKTDQILVLDLHNSALYSDFLAISNDGKDSIYFVNGFSRQVFIPKNGTDTVIVSADYPLYMLINYVQEGDNTNEMLDLAKRLNFYYEPCDTAAQWTSGFIKLKNKYRLGISPQTEVVSYSKIR